MRTWLSAFKRLWNLCLHKDLKAPLIEINLEKWEKTYSVSKATTFEKIDFGNKIIKYF